MKELVQSNEAEVTNRAVMVFCENKAKLNKICEELQEASIINLPFHDNSKQISLKMRYKTLNLLQEGKVPVIVSDNLGSRGLDTMNVSHVIQFEYAKTAQEYLQRVGRTGRMGQPGKVINFIRERDVDLHRKISEKVQDNEPLTPLFKTPRRRKSTF